MLLSGQGFFGLEREWQVQSVRGLTGLIIIIIGGLCFLLAGCSSCDAQIGCEPYTEGETGISFQVSIDMEGLTATLEISGFGTFPMTINADGVASAIVPDIPTGWHTFTATYYADGLILAQASTRAEVIAGQTITVVFLSQDLDRNFDEDGDGWVNLAEVLWGADPLSAASLPPGEDPHFVLLTAGGSAQSASYKMHDAVGEAMEGGSSTSGSHAMMGGFIAYP